MSDKFLSRPEHRADVSAKHRACAAAPAPAVEVELTGEQRAAIESWRQAPTPPAQPTLRTFQRVGHVVCCAPTRPDMPARNRRGAL